MATTRGATAPRRWRGPVDVGLQQARFDRLDRHQRRVYQHGRTHGEDDNGTEGGVQAGHGGSAHDDGGH